MASLIPNRLRPAIVHFAGGREEQDVFPTVYRCNTAAIRSVARQSGFAKPSIQYLTQYPSALSFSRIAFLLGMGYERLTRVRQLRFLRPWLLVVAKLDPEKVHVQSEASLSLSSARL